MAEKNSDDATKIDDLSRLQSKLDNLGVMFYTYLGIIQRDAPPKSRPQEEADELVNDAKKRETLKKETPGFAKQIVQASCEIESLISEIDAKVKAHSGKERDLLNNANFESVQAGEEMTEAVDDANKLLSSMRDAISTRESEP